MWISKDMSQKRQKSWPKDINDFWLMYFDQILTKYDQILIIYVKNQSMHVKNIQERHFLEINKFNVKNNTGFGWGNQLKPIKIN